jgi:hypothetical protein
LCRYVEASVQHKVNAEITRCEDTSAAFEKAAAAASAVGLCTLNSFDP